MARYINASDVSKVLGKKYNFTWAKPDEILKIINNKREKFVENVNFELNKCTQDLIQHLPKQDLKSIINTFKTSEELTDDYKVYCKDKNLIFEEDLWELSSEMSSEEIDYTKLDLNELKDILSEYSLSTKGTKQELIYRIENYNEILNEKLETISEIKQNIKTEIVVNNLNEIKKETVHIDKHIDYITKTKSLLNTINNVELKKALSSDFTMDRGNVEEIKIIKECNIKKDNKLRYFNFNVDEQKYKVGCRFDGEQVEIKCRKNKFLGVPVYEKVQMHFYMAAINVNEWTLKEKYNDQIKDHFIEFDNTFFEEVKNDLHDSWESFV